MRAEGQRPNLVRFVSPVLGIAAIFIAWEAYVRISGIRPVVLPAPTAMVGELVTNVGFYLRHTMWTTFEATLGFFVALTISVSTAVAMTMSATVRRASWPVLIMLQSTPVVLLAPILTTWFHLGLTPRVIVAALFVYVPLTSATYTGLTSISADTYEVFRSVDASEWEIMRHLRLRHALPAILAVAKVGIALCFVGAMLGEIYSPNTRNAGLGVVFASARTLSQADQMLASVACAGIVGLIGTALITLAERNLAPPE